MPIAILLAALCAPQATQSAPPAQPPAPVDVHAGHPARELFLKNCAQCHGENGDGHGPTKLDRDPRNFQAGGFSYGNTPEAIARTITYGIPGSPMPSFEKALQEEQRKLLAEYVLLLGPEQPKSDPKDSVLLVTDKPVIVRGKLPPIVEGGPAFPRGLVIGTPEGLSFEYRVDDVRLLAVLKGEFADRADWRGRGGDALVPLGKAVFLPREAEESWIFARFGKVVRRQLRATQVLGGRARLVYDLVGANERRIATVTEIPSTFACTLGGGYARRFEIEPGVPDPRSAMTSHALRGALVELCARRGLPSPRQDLLVLEEILLPGVLWPADVADQKKLVATFQKESQR